MTNAWPLTMWSDARQICAVLRWPRMLGDDEPPDRFFRDLRAQGRDSEATLFLGQALPRFEAVLWAAGAITTSRTTVDAKAMAAVHGWLREPSDRHRRIAGLCAQAIRGTSAARLCAQAVFVAGGSLMSPDKPAIAAPKDATGRLAAAAVLAAAADSHIRSIVLARALDHGSLLAAGRAET